MNIANILTVSRFFLTIIFAVLAQVPGAAGAWAALCFFGVAVLTDFLDGYIARKYNLITVFGQIMDPIADKFLTLTALFIFAFEGTIALWMVILVACREIGVTSVRIFALTNGKVMPAESAGKWKAAFQMGAVLLALVYRVCADSIATHDFIKNHQISLSLMINMVMMGAVILTVWSGLVFFNSLFRGRK